MQEAISERFIKAYNYGLEKKLFKTQSQVAGALDWNQSTLNLVLKGKRQIPLEIAIAFCNKYGFNRDWMLEGKGQMLASGRATELDIRPTPQGSPSDPSIPHLLETIRAQEVLIQNYIKLTEAQATTIEVLKGQLSVTPTLTPKKEKKHHV